MGFEVRSTPLTRTNPLTKIAIMLLITVGVVLSIDVVSASLMMVFVIAFFPLTGFPVKRLFTHLWFIPLAAFATGWATVLLAEGAGPVLFTFGPYEVTARSVEVGFALFLRSLAMSLPCVVLAFSIDSTELADSLVQLLKMPERFVLGALGAARLAGLLSEQLETIGFARRARGVSHGGFFGGLRDFFPIAFALLTEAIRRAVRLAMAMEGRAFGTKGRTWTRRVSLGVGDWVAMGCAAVLAATCITAAVITGHWNFILS